MRNGKKKTQPDTRGATKARNSKEELKVLSEVEGSSIGLLIFPYKMIQWNLWTKIWGNETIGKVNTAENNDKGGGKNNKKQMYEEEEMKLVKHVKSTVECVK